LFEAELHAFGEAFAELPGKRGDLSTACVLPPQIVLIVLPFFPPSYPDR